jgi:phospholipid/cholesterol/gamma-HCH transport system permease protein
LIGVVFAYLLGIQARRYGATIFVVDGVGLAICRELGAHARRGDRRRPLRAAFTAQIGSMKVQEETDAIRTSDCRRAGARRSRGWRRIVIGLPLLVFVGDIAGIVGGMLVSAWQLDIPPRPSRPAACRAAAQRRARSASRRRRSSPSSSR